MDGILDKGYITFRLRPRREPTTQSGFKLSCQMRQKKILLLVFICSSMSIAVANLQSLLQYDLTMLQTLLSHHSKINNDSSHIHAKTINAPAIAFLFEPYHSPPESLPKTSVSKLMDDAPY